MRTEKEMFELIMEVAKADERIRAVLLVGSRANLNAPKDKYQDYDITYFVDDVGPFYNNIGWIEEHFGKPAIMQLPELMTLLPPEGDGHFTYLMIFEDGNRIDLSIESKPYVDNGEPAVVLLDKDGLLPKLSPPTDKYWHIKPPTHKLYSDCSNEFWWCLNNVAKGIARDELSYVMGMLNLSRDMLIQMTEWYIGTRENFSVSAGKMGKYFKRLLPPDLYEMFATTYPNSDYENIWTAVFATTSLFRIVAKEVASHFGYTYCQEEDTNMTKYLEKVKEEIKN